MRQNVRCSADGRYRSHQGRWYDDFLQGWTSEATKRHVEEKCYGARNTAANMAMTGASSSTLVDSYNEAVRNWQSPAPYPHLRDYSVRKPSVPNNMDACHAYWTSSQGSAALDRTYLSRVANPAWQPAGGVTKADFVASLPGFTVLHEVCLRCPSLLF